MTWFGIKWSEACWYAVKQNKKSSNNLFVAEFSFSKSGCLSKAIEIVYPTIYPWSREKIDPYVSQVFCSVSLFNGISIFVVYFMPNLSLLKNHREGYLRHGWGEDRFSKGISMRWKVHSTTQGLNTGDQREPLR